MVLIMQKIIELLKKYSGYNFVVNMFDYIGNSCYGYYLRRLLPIWYIMLLTKLVETIIVYSSLFSVLQHDIWSILRVIILTLSTSLVSFLLCSLVFLVYLLVVPFSIQYSRFDKIATLVLSYIILYTLNFVRLGTELFWQEFANSFHFYGPEITAFTANHLHSFYSIHVLLAILLYACFLAFMWLFYKLDYFWPDVDAPELNGKLIGFSVQLGITALLFAGLHFSGIINGISLYNNDMIHNSSSSIFYDLMYNRKFERVYSSAEPSTNLAILQAQPANRNLITYSNKTDITKRIRYPNPERRMNVMLIIMENMDAENLEKRIGKFTLTPALNRLANRGIYFRNVYATTADATASLDAILLSIPAFSSRAIIQSKHNQNIYNLANIFNSKGYQSKFIYGSYSFVNNIQQFFSSSGYTVIDRNQFQTTEHSFENIWGLSDTDLFNKVLFEADKSYLSGKRFLNVVLTTSNQKPYNIPIIPVQYPEYLTQEQRAIYYADYAIGEFMAKAAKKPWFNNTLFVFVANTTSIGTKRAGLSTSDYRIPLIFYAPQYLTATRYRTSLSQIDVAPTLLGILRFNYTSRFFGMDALQPNYVSRYFITNDYTLRYITNEIETILRPGKIIFNYSDTKQNIQGERYKKEAIAFFQTAYYWPEYLRMNPTKKAASTK